MTKGKPWSRDELMVAMNIYCKLPFGQFYARNPFLIELAAQMGRSPASLAMKLCNLASLDPIHQARGVKGLSGASRSDREIWNDFQTDWETEAFKSEALLSRLRGHSVEQQAEIVSHDLPREGLERERIVRQRVNQHFFRSAVLFAYNHSCCITGLALPELLVASHVIPWAENKATRVNPANGLCLNALHDRAFDRGLITISNDFRVVVSQTLQRAPAASEVKTWILDFDGRRVRQPERFSPDPKFLAWHRQFCFKAAAG